MKIEEEGAGVPDIANRGTMAKLARSFGVAIILALVGALAAFGILRATSLVSSDRPQIWVRTGCSFSDTAVRAALHASPEDPVFLIPLDQNGEMVQNSCQATLTALDSAGYWWLRYFPEVWLCQRLAEDARLQLDAPTLVPAFYLNGHLVCEGFCEGAFDLIGHPELQNFVLKLGADP